MKIASLSEIKKELETLDKKELVELSVHLIKYKKENKELTTYLLFNSHDENQYINEVKEEINSQFKIMNNSNIYFAKKSIRKALRIANKYIKYSGKKSTEAELLLYFCLLFKETGIPFKNSAAMSNLYQRQLIRINKVLHTMHEDMQYDYKRDLDKINTYPDKKKGNILKNLFSL